MQTKLNPYINFRNNTRQVMEFYHSVFGGKLTLGTYKEFNASQDPSEDDLIMHAELEAENGITIMASDVPHRMELKTGSNFSISLTGDNETELTTYFGMLSAGGMVLQPLTTAGWGDTFGMCTDPFGVTWLVNIAAKKA